MKKLTKEQLQGIVEAADAVITTLAGTNEDHHKDNAEGMVRLWDALNDLYAPPEVVKAMAMQLLSAMDSKPKKQPVAWTDEQELRSVEKDGCGYIFTVNPITPHADQRRVIPLYRHAQPEQDQRREWMARGVDALKNIASEYTDTDCIMDRYGISYEDAELRANGAQELAGEIAAYAAKIRSGEVDL